MDDASMISDAVPAVLAAILTTLLPSGEGRAPHAEWKEIESGVPWGVLLLFGGGFAIADGVRTTGVDSWLGEACRTSPCCRCRC
jgi:solute carrier family 13 (sodium-dependent dicarboxylate transporter), member 2/3/5